MAIKSKQKNESVNDNILYLQDADAKALGIVEGLSQRVFIDDREVEVVFVDEHEVIPVSNEDKMLYQEAYKIAEKYAEASSDESSPAWNALVARSANARKENQATATKKFNFKESWGNFLSKFKKSYDEDQVYGETFDYDEDANVESTSMVKYNRANAMRDEANLKKHAKHSLRNDVFTKEELEIIQNVIDKSKRCEAASNSKSKVNTKRK